MTPLVIPAGYQAVLTVLEDTITATPVATISEPTPEGTPIMSTTVTPVTVVTTATPNKFVSFIKKLGVLFASGAVKAIAIVQKDAPAIEGIATTVGALTGQSVQVAAVEGTFNLAFNEIVKVEQIATAVGASNGTGAQKLAAAAPQVEAVILANPLFKNVTITDQAKWTSAINSITGALYDLGNSVTPVAAPTS